MADKSYIAKERLYLDTDGNVVDEHDPNRATLLVGAGGTLSAEQAERYGLTKKSALVTAVDPPAPTPEPEITEGVRQPGPNDPVVAADMASDASADETAGGAAGDLKARTAAANKAKAPSENK